MAKILEEGPIRKILREKGFLKRSPEVAVVEVDKVAVLRRLSEVEDSIRLAKRAADWREFEGAQSYIEKAHESLREASRLLGFTRGY